MTLNKKRIWIEAEIDAPKGALSASKMLTLTSSEAIEKMAKAITKDQWKRLTAQNDTFEAFSKRNKVAFYNVAEAALNALLGVNNE